MFNQSWVCRRPVRASGVAMGVGMLIAAWGCPASAWFHFNAESSDSALGSNAIVGIEYDGTHLWLATGKGVTRARLDGSQFVTFGPEVLNEGEISAIAARNGEIWVAPSYSEVRSNQLIPFGAGFNVTTDGGDTWSSMTPAQATGAGKICYDLAFLERDASVWAACFYGGLIRSTDGGATWVNVFPSLTAANDFTSGAYRDLNNRFFSVITRESSPDTMEVWAGSANGIKRFVYIDPSLKLSGAYGQALAAADDTVWLATEAGLSFSLDAGRTWRTFAEDVGFPTSYVASIYPSAQGIWAGLGSFVDTVGTGIAFSPDGGRNWQVFTPPASVGSQRLVTDFAEANGAVYAACGEGGLIYTTDDGESWQSDLPPYVAAEAFYSLATQAESPDSTILWAGTDDLIFKIVFTTSPVPDTVISFVDKFAGIQISHRVVRVETQPLAGGETVVWSLHQQTSATDQDGFAYTADGGTTWPYAVGSAKPFAIGFADSLFYLGTDQGLVRNMIGASAANAVWLRSLDDVLGGDDDTTDVRSLLVAGDSVWVGSDVGIAISADSGSTWAKVVSNPNPGVPDDTLHYRAGDTSSISGNFITALAQARQAGQTRLWAATQQTSSSQTNGISVSTDDGGTWSVPLTNVLAWNFAFDGAKTYVATSQGLMVSPDYGQQWDTINVFRHVENGQDTVEIAENTEVYSVFALRDTLWVGTEDGLAISFDGGSTWRVERRFEAIGAAKTPGPYATPVPWSPNDRMTPGPIRFHFVSPVDGPVTILIYDFSNRKVVELSDGISRQQGEQYDNAYTWNGENEKGEMVAVGTYFFIVEYADGSAQWGKLVVLP